MASLNSSITQLMQQYPTLSLQEIIAKMQSSNLVIPTSSALKTARELYVGNLPPNVTATQLQEFLGTIIQQVGLAIQPGNPILSTWISTDGHFAFCEMRSVEECNMALLMNQLPLLGQPLKFGRPKGFAGPPQPMPIVSSRTQTALVNLGCTPNPAMFGAPGTVATTMGTDLSAFLGSTASGSNTTSNRLVMMNIPVVLEEEQVKELAEPFGTLKSFSLVKDPITGKSSGNALFEYEDAQIAEEAIKGLHNLDVGGIHLVVQRAPEGPGVSSTAANEEQPSVAVKMSNMVSAAELEDDEEYNDLKEDVEEECKRFGTVVSMIIPRPKVRNFYG
jgi:splicing factor U2AF subunit